MPLPNNGVVKFTAKWCGPCKAIHGELVAAAQRHELELVFVDVDEEEAIMEEFGVRAMPTIVYMLNGKEMTELRVVGANMSTIEANMRTLANLGDANDTDSKKDESSQISIPCCDTATITCQKMPPRKSVN